MVNIEKMLSDLNKLGTTYSVRVKYLAMKINGKKADKYARTERGGGVIFV